MVLFSLEIVSPFKYNKSNLVILNGFFYSFYDYMMTQLVPLEDHILIEAVVEEAVSPSGFILPDDNKEKPSKGKVIAVWQWKILENWSRGPIDVSVWDTVYFTKYSPDEIDVDGTTYLVVKQSSILAVEAA